MQDLPRSNLKVASERMETTSAKNFRRGLWEDVADVVTGGRLEGIWSRNLEEPSRKGIYSTSEDVKCRDQFRLHRCAVWAISEHYRAYSEEET